MGSVRHWPLTGRDEELRELRSALDDGAPAVVLVGDTGIGKTRLAAEWVAHAGIGGTTVHWVSATRALSTIPFGAFGQLMPTKPTQAGDRLQLLLQLRARLRPAPDARLAVVVDDANLLDDGSAALVHQLASAEAVPVVLTVRAGEPVPDSLTALWKDTGARRIDLAPLDGAAVAGLVEQGLGGAASASLLRRLCGLSQGYPLFLSELLAGGIETGALFRRDDGVWHFSGSLLPSGPLTEMVAQRVARLPESARRAIEYLAVGGPLEAPVLERFVGRDALESLEAGELVVWKDDGARQQVALKHPVYGEMVSIELSRTRRRRVNRELATAVEALGMRRGTDLLRVASLKLESGIVHDCSLLTAAARQANARFDHSLAERLARAALRSEDDPEPRLVLGEALRCQNRFAEADRELRGVEATALTERVVAECALARAQTLFYGLRRPQEGVEVANTARQRITDPGWRAELDALIALLATFLGDFETAAETGERVLAAPHVAPRAVVNTLTVATVAQVMLGRLDEASRQIPEGLQLAATLDEPLPMAEQLLRVNSAFLDFFAGRVREAEQKYRRHYEQAVEAGVDELVGLWGSTMCEVLSIRGNLGEAIDVGGHAMTALQRSDPLGLLPMITAFQARNLALTGDARAARSLLARGSSDEAEVETRTRLHRDGARVWVAVAEGRVRAAAAMAKEAGARALEDGLVSWGMLLLYDAVRLGYPEMVLQSLRSGADAVDGDLLPLLATHAEALVASDASALEQVADSFEFSGAELCAAEASAQAAVLHGRAGATTRARRSSARAARLRARFSLAPIHAAAERPPQLTPREHEVALLAADGLTSPAIAARFVLSARTINNHLASVYRKLGIYGRSELPAALGLPEEGDTAP